MSDTPLLWASAGLAFIGAAGYGMSAQAAPISETRWIHADADAPRAARAFTRDVLTVGFGVDRSLDLIDDLRLIVSELVTNAVMHGPGGEVRVTLSGGASTIRIEVADDGTQPFEWPGRPAAGASGLSLVADFSARAGITRDPSTVVWAEFDR